GHGIGPTLHEEPHIPHFGLPNKGLRLKEGMVITIEPMINEGDWKSQMDANNWTARTVDKGRSAQYEHTIVITKEGPVILTEQDSRRERVECVSSRFAQVIQKLSLI